MNGLLLVGDGAMWIFHTALILFNILGWMWAKTRKWNLFTLGLTAFSWLAMGAFYGVGYCVCTDIHYRIRDALGIHDPSGSYLQLLVQKVSGWWPSQSLTNNIAAIVFGLSIVMSVSLNIRDARLRRKSSAEAQAG